MFKTRDGVVKERDLRWLSEEEAEGSRGNIRENAGRSMGRKRKGSRPDGPFSSTSVHAACLLSRRVTQGRR